MTMRQTLAATACAITLGLLAVSAASAQAADGKPCHKCDYRTAPPSPNPHDVMPRIVKVPCAPADMGDCLKTGK
ncbi:hypothetical protein [Asticcacaulis excentricus]|uniref:Lipoprotein n=1 Tax=Asticcacaulis excentricus (strain ATCC 15261 / DSM 4724 / KCTC 12464 / NCIMB 9791 / VKM B-1370 / CB 48) TaxID=573065 RepID=E8RW25_ASTEC|nr:hypothetical protein [Asticcacaulis excentricus]ADU15447.1 hypothetical protein Astex_3839 [Asticcacaulis excentricus CB 48]